MRFRDEKELPATNSGNFATLKDGESLVGVFVGEPYEFSTKWEGKTCHVVPDGTADSKFRFRINLIVKDPKSGYVAKIFEQGASIYRQLIKLNDELSGLETIVIKISRKGSTMNDTEYFISPLMDPKNPRQLLSVPKEALAIEHLDLGHGEKSATKQDGTQADTHVGFDEIPF